MTIKIRAQTRIDCCAQSIIKLNKNKNNFLINHLVKIHNHPLVMQECAHILPSQHKIIISQVNEVDLIEQIGNQLKFAFEFMDTQVGGKESLGYIKLFKIKETKKRLAYGKARSVLKYFAD